MFLHLSNPFVYIIYVNIMHSPATEDLLRVGESGSVLDPRTRL